jgi:hypothetical protein
MASTTIHTVTLQFDRSVPCNIKIAVYGPGGLYQILANPKDSNSHYDLRGLQHDPKKRNIQAIPSDPRDSRLLPLSSASSSGQKATASSASSSGQKATASSASSSGQKARAGTGIRIHSNPNVAPATKRLYYQACRLLSRMRNNPFVLHSDTVHMIKSMDILRVSIHSGCGSHYNAQLKVLIADMEKILSNAHDDAKVQNSLSSAPAQSSRQSNLVEDSTDSDDSDTSDKEEVVLRDEQQRGIASVSAQSSRQINLFEDSTDSDDSDTSDKEEVVVLHDEQRGIASVSAQSSRQSNLFEDSTDSDEDDDIWTLPSHGQRAGRTQNVKRRRDTSSAASSSRSAPVKKSRVSNKRHFDCYSCLNPIVGSSINLAVKCPRGDHYTHRRCHKQWQRRCRLEQRPTSCGVCRYHGPEMTI